jgi:hypothetical protein
MSMKNKLFHFLILFVFLFFLGVPVPVLARGAKELADGDTSFTFADLGQKDMNISVIYEQEFVDFPVAEGRKIDRAVLNLHMQHSEKLLADLSDIVIAINDEPVANLILTPENAADGFQRIEIPVEALKSGENELLLRFNQRLVDNGCGDVNDKDLWMKIFSDSIITFTIGETPEPTDLGQFPLPFSTFAALPGSPQILIVLPPAPTSAELSAAAQFAASLGQAANWKNPPLTMQTFDKSIANQLASDALIVINTGGRNPLATSAPTGVSVSPSPYNSNQLMLTISGADDAELLRSTAMLTTRSARANLTGTHVDPTDTSPQSTPDRPTQSKFAELGLTTKRVRGIGLHDLYYPIDIPYDWKTTSEASVELQFRHGAAITSASLMTVFINGFETANIRLDRRNDENGRLVIQLSPRQIHPGRNWLHIGFDLHMTRENCKYRYFEEAWAEVSAERSLINLAHVVSLAPLDLHYMPSYLVVPNDLSADLFVLPTVPTKADLTTMVRIAAKLGTYSSTDTVLIRAATADHFDPQNAPANVIAIGSPETNSLISAYDAQLPQPLTLVNGQVLPAAGRELLPEERAGQAAYIEVMTSPWSRSGSLLLIGAHTPDLLLQAAEILPSGGRRLSDEGNVAIVTPAGVTGLSLGNLAGISLSPATRKVVSGIFIGTFVLIALTGGFIVYRGRKAPTEESN